MAEDTKIIKTYGKLPKTNGTVEIAGAIVTDLKVAPEYEVETVDVGGVPEGGKRTLKSVKTTGTLYVLDTGSVAATESPLETLAETLATENDLAPAGGSSNQLPSFRRRTIHKHKNDCGGGNTSGETRPKNITSV